MMAALRQQLSSHLLFVVASAGQVVIRGVLQISLTWHCLGDGLTVFVAPGQV